jgi:Zn-dependent protease
VPPPSAPRRSGITPIQWVGLAVFIALLLYQTGVIRPNNLTPNAIVAQVVALLPFLVALLVSIPFHEFSHGLVATLFGDDTPRRAGRLTLNPLRHLDPLGTLMILVVHFGWGKPMPINPNAMRNPNLGWALSSVAGPISNVVLASIAVIALGIIGDAAGPLERTFITTLIQLNVALAVFNLLPIPPLDGFGFVFGLAPTPIKIALLPIRQYGPFILLALLLVPAFRPVIDGFLATGSQIIYAYLGGLLSVF